MVKAVLTALFGRPYTPPAPVYQTRDEMQEKERMAEELKERAHSVARRVHVLEWQVLPTEFSRETHTETET